MRLAEARGSLRAPNSRVQDRVLEYLILLAARDREVARRDALKHSLLVGGSEAFTRMRDLFPEYVADEDAFEQARTDEGDYDIDKVDDAKVTWTTPANEEEDDDISAWIASRESGSVTVADLDDGWK